MGGACSTNGEDINVYKTFVRKREGRRPLGGRLILEWILERQDEVVLTAFIWLRIGTRGGLL
jgi:hypothetical protein